MQKTEIKQLIDKFMAGATSLEEEQKLSEYFRSGDVPREWMCYKQMFAYFDDGMADRSIMDGDAGNIAKQSRLRPWLAIPAAAAAALALMLAWPSNDVNPSMPSQSGMPAVLAKAVNDSVARSEADSTKNINAMPSRRKAIKRMRFEPAPPRHYLAEAHIAAKVDSLGTAPDVLAQTNLDRIDSLQKSSIDGIDIATRNAMIAIENMAASEQYKIGLIAEGVFEEETEPDNVY